MFDVHWPMGGSARLMSTLGRRGGESSHFAVPKIGPRGGAAERKRFGMPSKGAGVFQDRGPHPGAPRGRGSTLVFKKNLGACHRNGQKCSRILALILLLEM